MHCEVIVFLHDLFSADILTPLQEFLAESGRKVREIKGDGNCFFRSLSFILFGNEEEHVNVRTLLVRFENLNSEIFKSLMTEVNEISFEEHIKHIMRPGTWATHVEVKAAATYFQVPVYFCQDPPQHDAYCWHVFMPVRQSKSLRYPTLEESVYDGISVPTHFEIKYIQNVHYSCIVCVDDSLPTVSPVLTGKTYYDVIDE